MSKARSPVNKIVETAVSELLDSKAESRIYIYLLRKNRARSDDIIRGPKLHPSTVRELLSKMYENRIIFREKIQTDTIGKNPYLYGAISPLLLLQRRVKIRNIYMQSDLSTFLPQDDPSLLLWKKIDQEFQIGSTIIIYIEADDIRDPYVLREMDRVTTKINTYELDKGKTDGIFSVSSIAQMIKEQNARPTLPMSLGGTGKYEIPEDSALIITYLARLQASAGILFLNTYTVAVIIFQLSDNADYTQILNHVKATLAKEARYSTM